MRLFFLLLLVSSISVIAQDEQDTAVYRHEKSIMIIPFEEKLYHSEIDRDLAGESGQDHATIVREFVMGTAFQFKYELLYRYKAFTLINSLEDSVRSDMDLLYANIGYEYKVLKDSTANEEGNVIAGKLNRLKASTQKTGTYMKNGEIVSVKDERKKFMSTIIRSDTILPYMNYRYEADYYLFINQIDLVNDLSDANQVSLGNYDRILRFHYSVLDQKGKTIDEGVLEQRFSKNENDIKIIVNEHIKACATTLRKKLGMRETNQEEVKPTKSIVMPLKKLNKH